MPSPCPSGARGCLAQSASGTANYQRSSSRSPPSLERELSSSREPLLPRALGFAAGAMIFVVVEEIIPECQRGGNASLATAGAMIGFAVMMVLDVAFGLVDCWVGTR